MIETSSKSTNTHTMHKNNKHSHTLSYSLDLRGSSVTTFSSQSLCECGKRETYKQGNKRRVKCKAKSRKNEEIKMHHKSAAQNTDTTIRRHIFWYINFK